VNEGRYTLRKLERGAYLRWDDCVGRELVMRGGWQETTWSVVA